MYTYHVRLADHLGVPVVSIAVLTDTRRDWRPDAYDARVFDHGCVFTWRVLKLLDFEGREDELERSTNPFALLLLAHLKTLRTAPDRGRLAWKLTLVWRLVAVGWPTAVGIELLRLVDWLMALPPPLQAEFDEEVAMVAKEKRVELLASFERKAIRRGWHKGRRRGREEGRAEGRMEGRAEGRMEGQVEGQRKALQVGIERLLEARGESLSASARAALLRAHPDHLLRILEAVGQGARPRDVDRLLEPSEPGSRSRRATPANRSRGSSMTASPRRRS